MPDEAVTPQAAALPGEPGGVPPGVDPRRANVARVYDYLLGGRHNFLPDQDLGRALIAVEPNAQAGARANRDFLGRAVRFLSGAGIRQFLDIGAGLPTQGNVHEVAHAGAILAGNGQAAAVPGDLRDPAAILADPAVTGLIDFRQSASPAGPDRGGFS